MALRKTGNGKVGTYPTSRLQTHGLLYNFDIDGHMLKKEHQYFLETVILPSLAQGGSTTLWGMCSRSGSNTHNNRLSIRRVNEVRFFLQNKASASHKFWSQGVGEGFAWLVGQRDKSEDQYYRAVSILVSPKPVPEIFIEKKKKPEPYPPKTIHWQKANISLNLEELDIFVVKKLNGQLYLSKDPCSWIGWSFSASNLNITVPTAKGKPPIWYGEFNATSEKFWYNYKIFDPMNYWNDKTILYQAFGKKIKLTIRDALPAMSSSVQPLIIGPGIIIRGRDVTFTLKSSGFDFGRVEGGGYIDKGRNGFSSCA